MVKNYNLKHRLIACILLVNLFLQSCGNSFNQPTPQEKELTNKVRKSTKQNAVNPLVSQELTAEKDYLVNFYEKNEKLLANVRVDESQKEASSKKKKKGGSQKPQITKKKKEKKLANVKGAVEKQEVEGKKKQNGGDKSVKKKRTSNRGKSAEKDKKKVSEEAGKKKKASTSGKTRNSDDEKQSVKNHQEVKSEEELLKDAKNGDSNAQYQLGKKAYDSWEMEKVEERKAAYEKEARKWLGKAAIQQHAGAIALLRAMNWVIRPEIELKKELNKKKVYKKGDEGQKANRTKEEKIRKSVNDLPSITYNHETALEVLSIVKKRMGLSKIELADLYLNNIKKKLQEIKDYQLQANSNVFYPAIKANLIEIRNIANCLYEHVKPYDTPNSNTLKRLIVDAINPFEIELDKRLEMSSEAREELESKTKRLYAQQSYIVRKGNLQRRLQEHLSKINLLLVKKGESAPVCYISYAWPSKQKKEEEYWVQPFLYILYDHLKTAGIRVVLDIRDNKPGNSIYQFMGQYKDGNHIILVGTASLLQKHYSPILHAVKTELSIISNKPEQDQKIYGYNRIHPLLISGSMKTSFPEVYDKYSTVRDPREVGYIGMLRSLVDWAYEEQIHKMEGEGSSKQLEYERLWHDFEINFTELDVEIDIAEEVRAGYHRKRLRELSQDTQYQALQAQEEVEHSSAVTAAIIGAMMQSQGTDPKDFYSEYGNQYQRPSITPNFIERKGIWDKMVAHFEQSDQQILTLTTHGLGGVGKTELAKYYYLHPPRPYSIRAWFNAENIDQLYSQYVELARAHNMEYDQKMPIKKQAELVKNWLEEQKDCLLVYDNASGARELEEVLPEKGKHHILITSRNEVEWPNQKLDVDIMEKEEAIALICKITACSSEHPKLPELVSTLGYLPLALTQAGAYIVEKKTSIAEYLDNYRKYQERLMVYTTTTTKKKHEPVWVTFNINFNTLKKDCPSALATLKQASWFAATDIPEALLRAALENRGEELLWDDIKYHIGRYSLMRIDAEGYQLSMHRLLQAILRSTQGEVERKEILSQIALSIKRIYPKNENNETVENIALVRLLLPHMETILSHLRKFFNEGECNDFNLEFNLGEAYETLGNYAKAKENFHADLVIQQQKYKNAHTQTGKSIYIINHPDIARTLSKLGVVYANLGEYQKALQYLDQVLEMRQTLYIGNHPDIAISLNGIGGVYSILGQNQKALKYLHQALEMQQNLYAGNHPDIACSLNNIGWVYQELGRNQEALKYLHQTLEIWKALYSENHPNIASSLANIGQVYDNLGQKQEALKYLKKALEMRKAIYTGNHPATSSSLNNIGIVYQKLGQDQEALKYYQQALEMRQDLHTGNHPDIAASLYNIGNVYQDLNQPQEALKHLKQALEIWKALYADNHPRIAMSLNTIGNVYQDLNQPQEALKCYEQALAMLQALYTGNHSAIAKSLDNLGYVYCNLGQHQKALKYYQQALEMRQDLHIGNHPDIAASLYNIGNVYQDLNQPQGALKHYKQSLEMYQALYPNNHFYVTGLCYTIDITASYYNLGLVYQRLGEYQEALRYHEQALELYQAIAAICNQL